MTLLYAQPYLLDAEGFFFTTVEEYQDKTSKTLTLLGDPVEEFEIQFMEGEDIDGELFTALEVHQGNFPAYLEAIETWDLDDKIRVMIAIRGLGLGFKLGQDIPNDLIEWYEVDSLEDLACRFVEEGMFGEIPASLAPYISYEAIARNLRYEYRDMIIAGRRYVYCYP